MSHNPMRDLRQSYEAGTLDEGDLPGDPMQAFQDWFQFAQDQGVLEAHAMTLATVSATGSPSARIVLCRGADESGLLFFTNYSGRKAVELTENAHAAALFFWQPLERQVRFEGRVQAIPTSDSDAYFASRPRASQLGAWASPQSQVIEGRQVLEQNLAEVNARFQGQESIPRPSDWGGFRLQPERVEFWQGRASRLHDRLLYSRNLDDSWTQARLAP